MTPDAEIKRYVEDPGLLVELCRDVIETLEAAEDTGETNAMESQLREIARAIDKLERQNVPVPDALRAEKTRLAAALSVTTETTQTLNHLANELEDLLKEINKRIGRTSQASSVKKPRAKRSKAPKTDSSILRRLIVEALKHLGGSAPKNEVLQYMEEKLHGKLLPGDFEWREASNDLAWQNNACWERNAMKNAGILKSGSPRGVWELSEDHR